MENRALGWSLVVHKNLEEWEWGQRGPPDRLRGQKRDPVRQQEGNGGCFASRKLRGDLLDHSRCSTAAGKIAQLASKHMRKKRGQEVECYGLIIKAWPSGIGQKEEFLTHEHGEGSFFLPCVNKIQKGKICQGPLTSKKQVLGTYTWK